MMNNRPRMQASVIMGRSQLKHQENQPDPDLPKSLWQLQSMNLLQAFPVLKTVVELNKLSQQNIEFKNQFTRQAKSQINNIGQVTEQMFEHFDSYFGRRLSYLDKLISKMQAEQGKELRKSKKRQEQVKINSSENVEIINIVQNQHKTKKNKKKQKASKGDQISGKSKCPIKQKQSSQSQLTKINQQIELLVQNSKVGKIQSSEIFMCSCPHGSNIITDRNFFLEHLRQSHPSSKKFSNFKQSELKMSHFLLFNNLIENPFMVQQVFRQLVKWQMKDYEELFVCQCAMNGKFLQKGLTFTEKQFIEHIIIDHQGQNLKLSSHYIDFTIKKLFKNSSFTQQRENFLNSRKFILLKQVKHQKLRQNLFNLTKVRCSDTLFANPNYLRAEIFGQMINKCKQLTHIYYCKECKVFFKCDQQWKSHMVKHHIGLRVAVAEKQMAFQNSDNQIHQAWLNSIKSSEKKKTIIKCGCSLHTFSTLCAYAKHINKHHDRQVPNFSSHIRDKIKQKWIQNPNLTQQQVVKQLQINNFYYCGHCPKILFQIKNQYIMHILTMHGSFHPKNSHYVMYLTDPAALKDSYKQIQNSEQCKKEDQNKTQNNCKTNELELKCRNMLNVDQDHKKFKLEDQGKDALIKIPRKPLYYAQCQQAYLKQEDTNTQKQTYSWVQTERKPIYFQNQKRKSLISTQGYTFDYAKTERKNPEQAKQIRVTRYNSTKKNY